MAAAPAPALIEELSVAISETESPAAVVTWLPLRMAAVTVLFTELPDPEPAPESPTPPPSPPAKAPATPIVSAKIWADDEAVTSSSPPEWTVEASIAAVMVLPMPLMATAAPTDTPTPMPSPPASDNATPPPSAVMLEESDAKT